MKAETIRKYYGRPTLDQRARIPSFVWYPKKKGWPKTNYRLTFDPFSNRWFGGSYVRPSRFTKSLEAGDPLLQEEVDILKACLEPHQIATCTAASIMAACQPDPWMWVPPSNAPIRGIILKQGSTHS